MKPAGFPRGPIDYANEIADPSGPNRLATLCGIDTTAEKAGNGATMRDTA
jgi:hypothetical protein